MNKLKTYNRKTVICFDNMDSRKGGIEFLLNLNIPFTYSNTFPVIKVNAQHFIKHCLDLYLSGIITCISQFQYRKTK